MCEGVLFKRMPLRECLGMCALMFVGVEMCIFVCVCACVRVCVRMMDNLLGPVNKE